MDSLLIDFNSPKPRREDVPLIPGSLLVPNLAPHNYAFYSGSVEESNPFDMVTCQVAANYAAENDPFEMVLNDAMNCPGLIDGDAVNKPKLQAQLSHERARKSLSLPDLRYFPDERVVSQSFNINDSSCETKIQVSPGKAASSCTPPQINDYASRVTYRNSDSADWNYLDDIPPPDSFLNSTVDMSCLLDETLPTSSHKLPSTLTKQTASSDVSEQSTSSKSLGLENPSVKELHHVTHKSDEELKMLAHQKIESIITKAKLEVRNDIQDSIIHRRLSTQGTSSLDQEALALCTPKKMKNVDLKPKEISWSLNEWSKNEMKKLKLIFPETVICQPHAQGLGLITDLDKIDFNFISGDTNLSSMELPAGDLSFSSSLLEVTPKGKKGSSASLVLQAQKMTPDACAPSPPSSPVLLPLPLCEDAVRNLSLCSKYSPPHASSQSKEGYSEDLHISHATSNLEKSAKQAKLLLRKPVAPTKTNSKMAPMKATAPVQNMTRARSSLATSTKHEMSNVSAVASRKSVLKELSSKPAPSDNTRRFLRTPQSPSRTMSGSLPNLPTQTSKLQSRLPSPRRPSAVHQEPKNIKNRPESSKEKNMHQVSGSSSMLYSSPRPVRKGSLPNRPGSLARVLADVNSCSSSRSSPKCKTTGNQGDTPRRGRSLVTEKENFL